MIRGLCRRMRSRTAQRFDTSTVLSAGKAHHRPETSPLPGENQTVGARRPCRAAGIGPRRVPRGQGRTRHVMAQWVSRQAPSSVQARQVDGKELLSPVTQGHGDRASIRNVMRPHRPQQRRGKQLTGVNPADGSRCRARCAAGAAGPPDHPASCGDGSYRPAGIAPAPPISDPRPRAGAGGA